MVNPSMATPIEKNLKYPLQNPGILLQQLVTLSLDVSLHEYPPETGANGIIRIIKKRLNGYFCSTYLILII